MIYNIKKIEEITIGNKISIFQKNCPYNKCVMCYISPTLQLKLKFQSTNIYNNSFNHDKNIVEIKDVDSNWSIKSQYMIDHSYLSSDILIILKDVDWDSNHKKMNQLVSNGKLVCHF